MHELWSMFQKFLTHNFKEWKDHTSKVGVGLIMIMICVKNFEVCYIVFSSLINHAPTPISAWYFVIATNKFLLKNLISYIKYKAFSQAEY